MIQAKLLIVYSRLIYKLVLISLARRTGRNWFIRRVPICPLISATIHVTDNCNSRCITCNQWEKNNEDEMTTEEIKQVLEQLRGMGCLGVRFSGGEPLLRDDIGELIAYARSLGFRQILLATNGLLLSRRKNELIGSGISQIIVSIDGMQQTHDMIRGINGSFDLAMKAIDELNEQRKEGKDFLLGIASTLLSYNIDEIPALLDLREEKNLSYGLNLFDTSPYFFKGIEDISVRDDNKVDSLLDYIKERKKNKKGDFIRTTLASIEYARQYLKSGKIDLPCYLGLFFISIGPTGEVYSDCFCMKPLGNLMEKPLKEIVQTKAYSDRILKMYLKKCPGCTCGFQNNVRIDNLVTLGLKSGGKVK